RVKELLRRSLVDQAEAEALQLAEEEPSDAAALDLLVSCWRGAALREGAPALARGRAWLEAQLKRRPASGALLASLAAIDSAAGDAAPLEPRLRQALADGAGGDVSRVLEKLIRDELKRPEQADALLFGRLEGRPRLPSESMELAEAQIRNGDDAK